MKEPEPSNAPTQLSYPRLAQHFWDTQLQHGKYGFVPVVFLTACLGLFIGTSLRYNAEYLIGVLVLFFFVHQLVASVLNQRLYRSNEGHHACEQKTEQGDEVDNARLSFPATSICIVGYRECPELWRQCLEHIRDALQTTRQASVLSLYIVVDGDTAEDEYMRDIAKEVFSVESCEYLCGTTEIYIYLRPHGGKRHVMKFGFLEILRRFPSNEYIIVMDSDTMLQPGALEKLIAGFSKFPDNGCATGRLRIFNQENLLARIVNARYGYAFLIERGAMGWYGCMNCCSGPFSIYRQDVLRTTGLLDAFTTEHSFRTPVGPGDDRHLTMCVLNLHPPWRSRLISNAIADTETPLELYRFLQQQLRWSRSFYREQYFQITACAAQSWYLTIVTAWEMLLPFFVAFGFLPLWQMSVERWLSRFLLAFGINLVRTICLVLLTQELKMSYNVCMFGMYFLFLLPVKLYAIGTFPIQNWVTSSRKARSCTWTSDMVALSCIIAAWHVIVVSSGVWMWWRQGAHPIDWSLVFRLPSFA